MTKETLEFLNSNTLIGNTDQRGTAWHYRAEHQGAEPNHYAGPIPVADVRRRLFDWEAVSRPVAVEQVADLATMTHLNEFGVPSCWKTLSDKQAICRSDDGTVMGIFSKSYAMHQYDQWLVTTVADILDEDLSISSAGLLRDGRGRLGGSFSSREHHNPRRSGLQAQPARHDLLRRVGSYHLQTHRHRRGLRQHPRGCARRD